MLKAWLIGMVIGAASELAARALRLWLYAQPRYPVFNVVLMFGAVMGALSLLVAPLGAATVLVLAYAIGLAYEWLNFLALHWWHFPDDRFLGFRGRAACAAAVAVAWAAVPLMIHGLRQVLAL